MVKIDILKVIKEEVGHSKQEGEIALVTMLTKCGDFEEEEFHVFTIDDWTIIKNQGHFFG